MSVGWLVGRFVQLLLVALGVTIVVFLLLKLVPGDPAIAVLGPHATPEKIQQLHHAWALDRPLPVQVLNYIGRLFRGDLGTSLTYHEPVTQTIRSRLVPSAWLLIMGATLVYLVSVPLAAFAARRPNSASDHAIRAVPLIGFAMPTVWVSLMLILVFSLNLGIFPVGGFGTGFVGHVRSTILPAITLALLMLPILIRSLRTSLLRTLEADFIVTARSKGLSEQQVLRRHAFRNAAVSSVAVFAVNTAILVGYIVIIEDVYAIPGEGALLVRAVLGRDFPVVQALTLMFALVVLTIYFVGDIVLALLDPRIKY